MTRRVAALLSLPFLAVAHHAAAQEIAFDLPAGPLGRAVDVLVHQSGKSVILADDRLWHRHVPAVRGRMTADAAVRTLARHARADLTALGTSGWRITMARPGQRAPAPSPPPRPSAAVPQDEPAFDVVVLASKRGIPTQTFAGSVEIISKPIPGIESGTQALVNGSTIISSTSRGMGRDKLFVRGIADSGFSGRLQSVTGLYLGEVRLTYSASDPDLQIYDLASVETLQGPQGTLYGSGSMGGIIRLNPNMPRRGVAGGSAGIGVSAVAHGGVGSDGDAVVNLPLTGDLAVRAVGYIRNEAGFIDRPAKGRDVNRAHVEGGRITARWWLTDGWTVDAVGIAQASRSRDSQYATRGAPPLTVLGAIQEPYGSDYAAGHLVVGGRLGSIDLVSATGLASQDFRERFGVDATPFSRVTDLRRRHDMLAHETRLSHRGDDGTGWIAGLSYMRTRNNSGYRETTRFGAPLRQTIVTLGVDDRTAEAAFFAEGSVRVAPFLTLGAGVRALQSTTRSRFDTLIGVDAGVRREQWVLPTASAVLRASRDVSGYVRYQQGARASVPPLGSEGDVNDKHGERIATVDVGVRWHSDGGWTASASIERTRWRQLQFNVIEGSFGFFTGNLGDWTVRSAHAAVAGPVLPGLRIDATVTLNAARADTKIGGVVRLPAPDIANVIARAEVMWSRPLGRAAAINLGGWARYEGRSYGVYPIFFSPQRQGDYLRTGVSAGLDRGADRVTLSIDNPIDASGTRTVFGSLLRAGRIATPLQPATVRLGYRRTF